MSRAKPTPRQQVLRVDVDRVLNTPAMHCLAEWRIQRPERPRARTSSGS
jgi:hypothetical protein